MSFLNSNCVFSSTFYLPVHFEVGNPSFTAPQVASDGAATLTRPQGSIRSNLWSWLVAWIKNISGAPVLRSRHPRSPRILAPEAITSRKISSALMWPYRLFQIGNHKTRWLFLSMWMTSLLSSSHVHLSNQRSRWEKCLYVLDWRHSWFSLFSSFFLFFEKWYQPP